ncbi:MAG: hypothetical protein JWR08_25 [Enterovirga sp.]|jgi:Asp-tRNA(Asn)/Glu-tRNA(Gln) amidotransferase A subunit family amidase|nr:hypothetical protein [Enterovirga sp.]
MTALEISLAQAYLNASGQDPITAFVRSVRDLARLGEMLSERDDRRAEERPYGRPARPVEVAGHAAR